MNSFVKNLLQVLLITAGILFFLESVSSIAWYQRHRTDSHPVLSTVAALSRIFELIPALGNSGSEPNKFAEITRLRASGVRAYPSYLFDPQLHTDFSIYHLANPVDSRIVFCERSDQIVIWDSDEIGFRNPKGQLGREVDFAFIGDSYTEGACEPEEYTFAGIFRAAGYSVVNLGRSGSGPLFQLAVLREYLPATKPKGVIWFVFTGNDLANLREEKTSKLSLYLEDDGYSQNLLKRRGEVSSILEDFLDRQIELEALRRARGLPSPYGHNYGETLDLLEAAEKETHLLVSVADQIKQMVERVGARLYIVIMAHPGYDHELQDLTASALNEFAGRNNVPVIEIDRDALIKNKSTYYYRVVGHFSGEGYQRVTEKILEWLSRNRAQ